jgi:hypothetical protein
MAVVLPNVVSVEIKELIWMGIVQASSGSAWKVARMMMEEKMADMLRRAAPSSQYHHHEILHAG